MTFTLDARLAADTIELGDLKLCRVLLMNDCRFPWLILVPRRADLSEIHDLTPEDRALLIEESAFAGARLKELTGGKKINIGALGNMVAQLHVHVVARCETDSAWPGPVWGAGKAAPYVADRAPLDALRAALELQPGTLELELAAHESKPAAHESKPAALELKPAALEPKPAALELKPAALGMETEST